ncbi:MAG: class I SAM-dependent methyltransferase [Mesorhizobium sp.]|nr:class I SAM-dependent methyltransferase [Mesorhizobium sp.]
MTRLAGRIKDLIVASGPISVADYMAMCLFDPEDGYYTTREPFGVEGDFTTAPEISQMFGEIVGVWLTAAWQALGRPLPATIAEIGPGRGTLMKDLLRTIRRLEPEFASGSQIALIEASPRLVEVQRRTLGEWSDRAAWLSSVDELLANPLFIVGNELFDAIPVRQFVKTRGGWRERMVGLDEAGDLSFFAGMASLDDTLLPVASADAPEGSIFEIAPARSAVMTGIAGHIAKAGGAGLLFDYGHLASGLGDTLQAVRRHAYDPVLAHPGEADLTSHVDFEVLAREAERHGLAAGLATQGEFLLAMGLLERAGSLGAKADEARREELRNEVERLAAPDQMGDLFKVLAISREPIELAPFKV